MGMYLDMAFEDYHAVDAVSASGLRVFARSAWHYRNRLDIKPTRPMLRGTLAHCALLEPDTMGTRYIVAPEDAPRRPTAAQWAAKKSSESSEAAKDWWREFEQRARSREIITAEEFSICQAQLRAISAEPELACLLAMGHGEVSIFWIDPVTRLYCKARLDWLQIDGKVGRILELKSTADESPSAFGRTAARMKYELQRAHYLDAIKYGAQLTPCPGNAWTWGVVTSAPPVLAVPYELPPDLIEQAADERADLMGRLAWCKETDQWPAYGQGKQTLDYPAYAKRSGEVEVSFVED
jgi:exodeoxyribonuclease VIII